MSISKIYNTLATLARNEFPDIVLHANVMCLSTGVDLKLRLDIIDGSFLDVYMSNSGRYSYHWERRLISQDNIYRHDNAPHKKWRGVSTFPKHFHVGSETNVVESHLSEKPREALRDFLRFVQQNMKGDK